VYVCILLGEKQPVETKALLSRKANAVNKYCSHRVVAFHVTGTPEEQKTGRLLSQSTEEDECDVNLNKVLLDLSPPTESWWSMARRRRSQRAESFPC
jgi:hypothetical protein